MPVTKHKYTLEDLIKDYELKNHRISDSVMARIVELINSSYNEVAYFSARARLVNNKLLPNYITNKIDSILGTLTDRIGLEIKKGAVKAWVLSEEKMAKVEHYVFGGDEPPIKTFPVSEDMGENFSRIRKAFGTGSETAAREFFKKELKTSSRVWKKSAKEFIKETLTDGIKSGKSARELSKDLRNATLTNRKGAMKSSGRGVYKDPKKNAYRLARNEINKAYLKNDHRKYQDSWWIIGKRIATSISHEVYDMCDELKGDYPKEFIFNKWHINCLCFEVPIIVDDKTRLAMMRFQLGKTDAPPKIKYITKIPKVAKAWVNANRKRMEGWKTTPEFITENEKYF